MNRLSRLLVLSAAVLAGCNLTYDREGLEFESPASYETCTTQGLEFCTLGTREFCADLDSDPSSCGGCGTVCGIGVECFSGVCGAGTAYCGAIPGEDVCGTTEYPVCVDTLTDANNCGYCGHDCGSSACIDGFCDVTCGGATPDKCSSATGFYCVDFDTDEANCGDCGISCPGTCTGGVCDGGTATLAAVAPLAPLNGANWNDWVVGTSYADAVDEACNPSSTTDCIHGGEARVVRVPGQTSCLGLTATDFHGWFSWSCSLDPVGGEVRFVAQRLLAANATTGAPEVRLADLIDLSTRLWKLNKVTVWTDIGVSVLAETPWTAWWGNPIAPLPPHGGLSVEGTVYVVDGTSPQVPVQIEAPRVGLVVAPPTVLRPLVPAMSVVSATGKDYLWIEGAFDATGSTFGVAAGNVRRSVLRSVDVTRDALDTANGHVGVYLSMSSFNRLRILRVTRQQTGLRLEGSSDNNVRDVEVASNGLGVLVESASHRNELRIVAAAASVWDGVYVNGSNDNLLEEVVSFSNGSTGMRLAAAHGNRLVNVVAAHNGVNGVALEFSTDNRVVAVTAAGNRQAGLLMRNSDNNVVLNSASYLGEYGLYVQNSASNTLIDLAVSDVGTALWSDSLSPGNRFLGSLLIDVNSLPCYAEGGGTGFDTDCNSTSGGAARSLVGSFGSSFVGAPVASESVNTSYVPPGLWITDLDGSFDWTGFENGYRAWGPVSGAGPLGCSSGGIFRTSWACTAPAIWSGDATVFDWSLRLGDFTLRERLSVPASIEAIGDHLWSTGLAGPFLPRVMEWLSGAGGNDDGLCEAGETCILTPNYGAYQGHVGLYSAGTVSGAPLTAPVTLYHYATNGY